MQSRDPPLHTVHQPTYLCELTLCGLVLHISHIWIEEHFFSYNQHSPLLTYDTIFSSNCIKIYHIFIKEILLKLLLARSQPLWNSVKSSVNLCLPYAVLIQWMARKLWFNKESWCEWIPPSALDDLNWLISGDLWVLSSWMSPPTLRLPTVQLLCTV